MARSLKAEVIIPVALIVVGVVALMFAQSTPSPVTGGITGAGSGNVLNCATANAIGIYTATGTSIGVMARRSRSKYLICPFG